MIWHSLMLNFRGIMPTLISLLNMVFVMQAQRLPVPEEPAESEADVVTLALRSPQGRIYRRRFYIHNKIQVNLEITESIDYFSKTCAVVIIVPGTNIALSQHSLIVMLILFEVAHFSSCTVTFMKKGAQLWKKNFILQCHTE